MSSPPDSGALEIASAPPLAPESLRLAAALWAELSTIYPEMTAPPFPPRDIVGERAVFMVASLGGIAIGCGAIRPLPAEFHPTAMANLPPTGETPAATSAPIVGEVKRMYVAPAARGRGVAAAILRTLEAWAAKCGYATLRLETGERQPHAVRLYERSGYHRIAPYGHHAADPLALCFEKSLR